MNDFFFFFRSFMFRSTFVRLGCANLSVKKRFFGFYHFFSCKKKSTPGAGDS